MIFLSYFNKDDCSNDFSTVTNFAKEHIVEGGGSGNHPAVDVGLADDMGVVTTAARKVMVIADPGRESAGALQWALSHSVVEHDELILLHVENSASWRNSFTTFLRRPSQSNATFNAAETGGGEIDFLDQMKKASEAVHPSVKVHIERVDMGGKDKAATILMQCKELSVDVLVIGQRRSLSNAILG